MFGLRTRLRTIIEHALGVRVAAHLPRGVCLFRDLRRWLPNTPISIIFDVGANTGQSARAFHVAFPRATIFCFEPVPATFARLRQQVGRDATYHCFQLAFGAAPGQARIIEEGDCSRFRLIPESVPSPDPRELPPGLVPIATLDAFCSEHRIDRISFLKVDTEGQDLDVLRGAAGLLTNLQIDLIEIEAGINPDNRLHVPLSAFAAHLEPLGYRIFGFYDQIDEWLRREPHLRRVNAVFISPDVVTAHQRPPTE